MDDDLTLTSVRTLLKSGDAQQAVRGLAAISPVSRAEIFMRLRQPEQTTILAAATPELAAAILADCDSTTLSTSLARMDFLSLQPALRLVPPDDLADLLLHLPDEKASELVKNLDPDMREEVRKLMQFDRETAGGLMTTRYLSVPQAVTIARAEEMLRSARPSDHASYVYVVDTFGRLVGTLPLRKLFLADRRTLIDEVASKPVVNVRVSAPRGEIIELFHQHHYLSLPVVDDKDRLVGIVTFDDVKEAMRAAEGDVVHGMTGVDPREAVRATLAATRSRLPWATVTIASGLACAFIAGLFEQTLRELVMLGIFIPIVLALGESIGSQTVSVALSSLATGRVVRGQLGAFVLKELMIGLLVGLYCGVMVAAASLLWHGNPTFGLLVGTAILISVSWAALLGVAIPSLMHRMRINADIASGPLVLAVADVTTLVVYFGGASLMMAAIK